jgi:hypothetical protein
MWTERWNDCARSWERAVDDELRDQILAWVEALDVGEPVTPDEARARAIAAIGRRDQRRRRVALAAAGVVLLATLTASSWIARCPTATPSAS